MIDSPPPAPGFSARAQRAYALSVAILTKAPILGNLQQSIVERMVKQVLDEVSRQLRAAEKALAKAGGNFNVATPAMPYLILGALSVAVEGYPDDDDRHRLYQAGREIGEFWTELVAAKIEKHLVEQAQSTQGGTKS